MWHRICVAKHHGVTHIVDFSLGSAGLAIAAAGAMEYKGVAANGKSDRAAVAIAEATTVILPDYCHSEPLARSETH